MFQCGARCVTKLSHQFSALIRSGDDPADRGDRRIDHPRRHRDQHQPQKQAQDPVEELDGAAVFERRERLVERLLLSSIPAVEAGRLDGGQERACGAVDHYFKTKSMKIVELINSMSLKLNVS